MYPPSSERLESAGITHEAHRFFVLRWNEIFDEFTFDSWQVRSSNLKTILEEILNSCQVVDKIHNHHPNIEMLIAEAIRAAQNDEIICEFFPFVHSYLNDLKTIYKDGVKKKDGYDTQLLQRTTQVILGNLTGYRSKLFDCLNDTIANPPTKFKIKLYSLSLSLGIELTAMGYSLSELRDSLKILLNPDEEDFSQRFNSFLDSYSGVKKSYTCFFHISLPKGAYKFPEMPGQDMEITKARPENLPTGAEREFYEKDKKSFIGIVKTSALDAYSAKYMCEQKIEDYFAVAKIYQVSQDLAVRGSITLVRDDEGNCQCLKLDSSRTRYIRDSGRPVQNISAFTKLLNELGQDDSNQILASLQYHKLAISAPTDEAKFINLWIGMESLVQGGEGSVISRITDYMPPTNSLDYIFQMMKFLPISIKGLWRSKDTGDIRSHLSRSNRHILHPADMLAIFLSDPKGELVNKFCELISDNPLLLFRTERLWESYFKSPEKLADSIELHNKNVTWQLCRIYRARNEIMHQGRHLLGLRQLMQHLHTYYATTIHALIHDLKKSPSWSIIDAFEHRRRLYDHFLQRLKNYNDNPICAESLLHPAQILKSRFREPAWKIPQEDE